ncbi:MAG: ADOP family duplicated permease [Gemmatimonas sp.]
MTMNERIRKLFRFDNDHQDVARAVDDELQFHFDSTVRDLMASGLSETEARQRAHQRFGDVEQTRRGLNEIDHARVRDARRIEWFANVGQDLRYALRGLRRNPVFAVAVVAILALGIGANATMFDIVDRLLLRTPPTLIDADRVHRVYLHSTINNQPFYSASTSYHRFRDLADSSRTIDVAAAVWNPTLAVGELNAVEERVTYATASYWKLFEVAPALGRFYTEAEDVATNPTHVTVLSHAYWQRAFGGRDSVIGKQIRLGRINYTIIGVAPESFIGLSEQAPAAWIPIASGGTNTFPGNGRVHWYDTYGMNWLQTVVRRRDGVSREAVNAELSQRFQQSYANARSLNANVIPIEIAKPSVEASSVLVARGPNRSTDVKVAIWLVGVAAIVLLIACANVGNLMLARALQRQREIAVRLALGISRSRLIAQTMIESTLLAILGGVAGLAATAWGGGILRATLVPDLAVTSLFHNVRTPLFTMLLAVGVGMLTGLVPAFKSARGSLSGALKAGGRGGDYQRSRLRSSLLVVQAAMSVVLLVGAGLFVTSLRNLQSMSLGFDSERVVWVSTHLRTAMMDSTRQRAFYEELVAAAKRVPGVEAATFGLSVPFATEWEEPLFTAGIDSVNTLGRFELQHVGPEYMQTMGTRILRGRALGAQDVFGAPPAMVVSASMAAKLWPGQDALSKCMRVGADTTPCRAIVGIAQDIKSNSLTESEQFQYYMPRAQMPSGSEGQVFVRVSSSATLQAESIRKALQTLMPGDSYVTATSLDDIVDPGRRSWKLGATMFSIFGSLALVVAALGLYSVISYTVAQRTREMGVRIALGAQSLDVIRMILRQSVALSALAIALGVGIAMFAGKWVEPLLFETSPYDARVYVIVASMLLLIAVAAALAPALRASRVDASEALRSD